MLNSTLILTRTKRFVRLWIRDAILETVAPLTDTNARLNFIGVLVLVFMLTPHRGPGAQLTAAITILEAAQTVFVSIPIFFSLNLLFAIFRVRKEQRALGTWFGSRFIYHHPRLLLTALVDERDNGKALRFSVEDAENNSLVSYAIETGRQDNQVKVELAWPNGKRPMEIGQPMNIPKGSFRLPESREMSLLSNVEPQTTLTTVRVFMTGWEVGNGDGRG